MSRRSLGLSVGFGLALALLLGISVATGQAESRVEIVELRAIRAIAAALSGASLAVGGVLAQGLFRNPLASPSILGTTAGATLGAQLAIWATGLGVLQLAEPELASTFGALAGAAASLAVLLALFGLGGDLIALLLTGFVLSAFFLSFGGLLIATHHDRWEMGRAIAAFSLGSVGGAGRNHLWMAIPWALAGTAGAAWLSKPLDVMLSGEAEARSLGVDVRRVRRWSVVWISALVASAVTLGGNIAFVGLVVPHIVRRILGPSHGSLWFPSAALGATFVVGCDLLARSLPSTGEVPLGVITGLIGAPVFLMLLHKERGGFDV